MIDVIIAILLGLLFSIWLMGVLWTVTPFRPCKLFFHDILGWHEPDPSLPGFVTDYGRCGKEQIFFAARVCNLEPFECESYEYDDGEEFFYRKQIERIKEEMK